jgi:hypothetical protein
MSVKGGLSAGIEDGVRRVMSGPEIGVIAKETAAVVAPSSIRVMSRFPAIV